MVAPTHIPTFSPSFPLSVPHQLSSPGELGTSSADGSFSFPSIAASTSPASTALPSLNCFLIAVYAVVNSALTAASLVQLALTADPDTLVTLGNQLAVYGTVNVLLVLFPVTRNSVWNLVLGVSFERAIWYHKWLARVAVLQLGLHGAAVYASQYDLDDTFYYLTHYGTLSFFTGVLMVVFSLRPFRRRLHRWFLRVHIILFLAFVVIGLLHNSLVFMILVSLVLYVWDWVLRLTMWRRPTQVLDITALPGGVTRVRFQMQAGAFKYYGGQFCFVCIPVISPWEWHPFSLSSSPHHPVLMLHIKTLGQWTQRLEDLATRPNVDVRSVALYVEGPYGSLSLPLERYTQVLMVAGGIGITPLGSLYNALLHEHYLGVCELQHMRLVWSVRDPTLIDSLYGDMRSIDQAEHSQIGVHQRVASPSFFSSRDSFVRMDGLIDSHQPRYKSSVVAPLASRVCSEFYATAGNVVSPVNPSRTAGKKAVVTRAKMWEECTQEGRPELEHSFQAMQRAMTAQVQSSTAGEVQRCAVLTCGPEQMIDQVRQICCRHSTPQMKFDLHEETFRW